jgi:hypothetical protein
VIWPYSLPDKGKCALTCCRTDHANGYIVSLNDGKETHIGRNCGVKYFGDDFLVKVNLRKAQIRYRQEFERVQDFYNNLSEHKKAFDSFVYPESGIGIYRIRGGIREVVNGNEKIGNMAKRDFRSNINYLGEIVMVVEKTEDEIELEKARVGDDGKIIRRTRVKLATIQNYELTTKLQQINDLIIYFEKLFSAVKLGKGVPIKDIKAMSKMVSDFPKRLRELKEISNQGRIFFERSNIAQMALALNKDYHQRDFLAWVDKFFPKADPII